MIYNLVEMLSDWLTAHGLYRYVMVFDQLNFRVFCSALMSFATVVVLGPRVIGWLRRKKIGDRPEFDHAEINDKMKGKANTPTMGGILIGGSMLASILLFADLGNDYVKLAVAVLVWHAGVGGADDWLKLTASSRPGGSRQGLRSWEKLVFQLGIGVIVGVFAYQAGGVGAVEEGGQSLAHAVNLPFQKTYENPSAGVSTGLIFLSPIAYTLFMTLFMAGMSNAVNITDGMDGLATGIAAIVGIGLVVLCLVVGAEPEARQLLVPYVPGAKELAVVAGALGGACLGFLWWNCSPAQVFMGDTGSLCIGGLLGYIAVVIRMEYVLLIMSGVFIWEILTVVIQVGYFRRTGGGRFYKCAPYHHHLHILGWPEQSIVVRFWIMTIVLAGIALASLKLR